MRFFFETVNIDLKSDEKVKPERGSQKQTKVLVMVESEENVTNKNENRPSKKVGFLKMKVISNLKTETINREIEKAVASKTAVITDA